MATSKSYLVTGFYQTESGDMGDFRLEIGIDGDEDAAIEAARAKLLADKRRKIGKFYEFNVSELDPAS